MLVCVLSYWCPPILCLPMKLLWHFATKPHTQVGCTYNVTKCLVYEKCTYSVGLAQEGRDRRGGQTSQPCGRLVPFFSAADISQLMEQCITCF